MVINWIHYLYLNQDLIAEGITTKEQAIDHYNNIGKKEGRLYKYNIPKDFDKVFYSNLYSNLKGLPDDVIYAHYTIYGRKNKSPYNSKKLEPSKDNLEIFFSKDIDKNIFFFAPHTPEFDSSSGGYRLLQILTILRNLKYNVYYFCNKIISPNHVATLEGLQIPIFVTNGHKYAVDLAKELYDHQNIKPNYIFVAWRDMAKQVVPHITTHFPNTKLIIDSVDIHWAREQRELDAKKRKPSSEFLINKDLEKLLYKTANVVLCVTDNDKAEILKEIPNTDINIKIVSNIYPDSYLSKVSTNKKDNIIFVGGFNHSPNIDAALWTYQIYSEFIKSYNKEIEIPKLYLVGSNPPKEILKLHNGKNIFVTGYVEDLSSFYNEAKVSISPLTWGAGIKGKICEAAYKNTTILTTPIGNEGINLINNKEAFICNSTEEFVNSLKQIYTMPDKKLLEMNKLAKEKIYNLTSTTSATLVLRSILETKPIIVCIVTYNKSELLKTCIKSIIDNTSYNNYKIVVIDNASTDNTTEVVSDFVKKYPSIVEYRRNKENEFFIKPNNKIIQEFHEYDIVLVNHDIKILSKCWLTRLYSAAYSASYIGCAGGKTIYPNGVLAEAGAELYNDGSGRNIGRNDDQNDIRYNHQRYVGYVSGCLMYMRRDAINNIGILDSDLEPMYYEDSEWQYRLHINGLKTIYEPRCLAIHAEGSSAGTDINTGMKRFQEINRKKFIQKYQNLNIEQFNECNILAHMRNE